MGGGVDGSCFLHLPTLALSKIRDRVAQHNKRPEPRLLITVSFLFFCHVVVLIAPDGVRKSIQVNSTSLSGAVQCALSRRLHMN